MVPKRFSTRPVFLASAVLIAAAHVTMGLTNMAVLPSGFAMAAIATIQGDYAGLGPKLVQPEVDVPHITVRVDSLPHRKWREIQQQPGTAGPGNMLGCCLIYFHFLWGKLSTRTVLSTNVFEMCSLSISHPQRASTHLGRPSVRSTTLIEKVTPLSKLSCAGTFA